VLEVKDAVPDARLHVARKTKRYDDWDLPYEPVWSGRSTTRNQGWQFHEWYMNACLDFSVAQTTIERTSSGRSLVVAQTRPSGH
jgi:hypothetical protein